ncbi:protein kinase [Sorangium cellulosum]|uniref:Protein kinase n=1 Tax=Sorangium cellulosum TaxID=56 RepID=A0A150TI73_SORCE|nr:protein kinase [Sorangium cellulosum]
MTGTEEHGLRGEETLTLSPGPGAGLASTSTTESPVLGAAPLGPTEPAPRPEESPASRTGPLRRSSTAQEPFGPPMSSRQATGPAIRAGTLIGHYELIRELGRGGMGTVFLGRDVRLGRLVGIKVVTSLTGARLQRFLVEARATALCKHENIVTIHDVNEHDGYPYMVLEYIDGQSLRAWMDQRRPAGADEAVATAPVSASAAVEMMVPVVRALSCAHKLGIVHRDLKPENIMLEASGAIKVLDFGIAKLLDTDVAGPVERAPISIRTTLTREGAMMGTIPYMSPEQWLGEGIDHASDIWAVGIMLYELVTGAHPLAPVTVHSLMQVALLDQPMPELDGARPELGALGGIIDRCLRKRKAERTASAQQLLSELLPLLPGRHEIVLGADESPFAGLSAFQEADADRFFGRAEDVARMVTRLRSQPLLAIVGASGVGKSSLVRAGIVPALKRSGGGWESLILRPGREPMAALAELLGHPSLLTRGGSERPEPSGGDASRGRMLVERLRAEPGYLGAELRAWAARKQRRVVLFVDQFEELYTLSCDAGERAAFLSCLGGVADDASSPLRVILSMRSDFIERVAEDRHFMAAVTRGLVVLPPIGRAGLRDALTRPVQAARYEIEDPALVEDILDVLETTRGALPLLQFMAARWWDLRDRERRLLTRASYEAIGGVAGTLASHADAVLAGLGGRQAKLCRAILERLVTPERTRAIASLEELRELPGDGDPDELESVVHLLADARLLAIETGRDDAGSKVEIVHESLIARWPTLLRWLDENQEDAVFLGKLRAAARHWASSGGADDLLWRGKLAEEARRFRERSERRLPEREQRYLDAVIGLAGQAQRRKRNLIVGTIASLALLVVGATAGIVTVVRQNRVISAQLADIRRTEDSLEEALARETASRQAAEQARMSTEEQRKRAELLQREAEEARDRAEAEAERARAAAGEARTARDEARTSEAEARRAKAQADDERARAGVEERKAKQAADDERRSKEELEQLIRRSVGRIRDRLR